MPLVLHCKCNNVSLGWFCHKILRLCGSLIQRYYIKNGPNVTVTSHEILNVILLVSLGWLCHKMLLLCLSDSLLQRYYTKNGPNVL